MANVWENQAESLIHEKSLRAFIAESHSVLHQLATTAQEHLQLALSQRETAESQKIRNAYLLWLERYKLTEMGEKEGDQTLEKRRQQVFAEQAGYVYFVRLLLARILEDKAISFLPLTCRHFFQQPVFDWFLPDDYLLALMLHRLSKYNFKDVTGDLLGFTYEAFIDRVARNKKGHFLTPPAVVEFMLDRAGYSGPSIIGESLIDTACGSGSFLVHAARRLRQALATTTNDPVALARLFIDQVQIRLVGLEVNPFSCYLAELNLFIQMLDDLSLLWQNGENPTIERFAIYNTNSLEMPQAVLHSKRNNGTTTSIDEATALDKAAPIKAKPASFTYVICNPPYVNRGIILGTKSYGKFPFYQDVVKGDENFYLLFLRLVSYYVSPGGTVCFICPLNLLGDESTMPARELFGGPEWTIQSITRFYARDVLFSGVLQGVCIIRLDNLPSQALDMVEIRGGHSVEETAQAVATHVQRSRIINNYPARTTWSKPWLVNANSDTYNIWEFVRTNAQQDFTGLTQGKLEVRKGDVRSTWAKPMLVPHSGRKFVPLTKGKDIIDWDGWSASSYLDPSVTIPSSVKDYTSCLWVQRQVQRVIELTQSETVLFLKEVSGLEMRRPIRGTIIQRDGQHPIVADETVLVMYTLRPAYEQLAYALFGLLTSLTYNFLFSLFSTNAHVNFKEILRLPVPVWTPSCEQQLANQTRNVLYAYQNVHEHKRRYGTDQLRHVSVNDVLTATKLSSLRLEEFVLRGDIILHGTPNYTLEVMLNRGQLTINPTLNPCAINIIERFVRANGSLIYIKGGKDILLPNPRAAPAFLSQLEAVERERATKLQTVVEAQQALDDLVLDVYGITTPSWREVIEVGVPWARN